MSVLRKLFDQENQNWTTIIKQKSNEFTNFFKVWMNNIMSINVDIFILIIRLTRNNY